MKKRILVILTVFLLAFVISSCPTDEENTEPPGPGPSPGPSDVVQQDPIDPDKPWTKTEKKVATDGNRVYHEVWIGVDTNADPRNVLGYKLKTSGKQFFDTVVIFHTGLSWDHLDPDIPDPKNPPADRRGWCTKTGVHLHFHPHFQWLLADRDKFLKPIKDAGMKLLFCPLPNGQGMTYGAIGPWPNSATIDGTVRAGDDYWNYYNGGENATRDGKWEDIMGDAGARRWAKELADFCEDYGFDGIALDEEYGQVSTGKGWGLREEVYSQNAKMAGENIFRWLRYFKDYSTSAENPNGLWVSNYHHRYTQNIPATLTMQGINDSEAKPYQKDDVIDAVFPSSYGSYQTFPDLSPSRVYPIAVLFDASASVTPSPNEIRRIMISLLRGNFGGVMYFALRERSFYNNINYFGSMGSQPESYLSRIAQELYKDDVIYEGVDHPKYPKQRSTSNHWYGCDLESISGQPKRLRQ